MFGTDRRVHNKLYLWWERGLKREGMRLEKEGFAVQLRKELGQEPNTPDNTLTIALIAVSPELDQSILPSSCMQDGSP